MPDIAVYNKCNLNCIFCSNPKEWGNKEDGKYTFAEFKQKWLNYLEGKDTSLKFSGKNDFVTITGGEPTLNPDFFKILLLIKKTMPAASVRLLTNGLQFADEKFAINTFKLGGGNLEITLALLGYEERSYTLTTQSKGQFENFLKGMGNIFKYRNASNKITLRIILCRQTITNLDKLLDFALKNFPETDVLEILFPEYEGRALDNLDEVSVTMQECGKKVKQIFPKLKKFKEFRLLHFPLCVLDKELRSYAWKTLDERKVTFLPQCSKCRVKQQCVGIHKSYLPISGDLEIEFTR